MVQRDQWDTYRGPKKNFFQFAAEGALRSMAAAPVYIYMCVYIYIHIVYMYTGLGGWLLNSDLPD